MSPKPRVLAMVMAGGRGERLKPLTDGRSKPSVPFAGRYRIVDFVLSNLVNSGISSIYVLSQYKAQSLIQHVYSAWSERSRGGEFIDVVPAQMQSGADWYRGTADAVYQNIQLIREFDPEFVAVFGADHIYKQDVSQMLDFHIEKGAAATIGCLPVPQKEASGFGIVDVEADGRIKGFLEKPTDPPSIPGRAHESFASMGNYIFSTPMLLDVLESDARNPDSDHDFGKNVFPRIIHERPVFAYDFFSNQIPAGNGEFEPPYWRDVGTLEAYFDATMDLKNVVPSLNLYNWNWPIRTASYNDPPAKFVFDEDGRRGQALQSLVASGCILSGARVKDSVLGRNVFVHTGASIEESIIFDNVDIGRHCKIRRAIIDKNVRLPPGTEIGFDLEADRSRWFVSSSGITVIGKAPESLLTRRRNW